MFAVDHRDKEKNILEENSSQIKQKTEFFGHNEQQQVWRREGEAFNPNNTKPSVRHGAGSSAKILNPDIANFISW